MSWAKCTKERGMERQNVRKNCHRGMDSKKDEPCKIPCSKHLWNELNGTRWRKGMERPQGANAAKCSIQGNRMKALGKRCDIQGKKEVQLRSNRWASNHNMQFRSTGKELYLPCNFKCKNKFIHTMHSCATPLLCVYSNSKQNESIAWMKVEWTTEWMDE